MAYIKTKGIIIKEVNTGEADKIVTIFSRRCGKISGFAKGAKRTRSRYAAGTQFLCYSDLVLFKGKEMYSINTCDVIEPFYEIRNDMVKLTYAAHISELINDVIQEDMPSSKALQLLLNTLHMLAKTEKPPQLITIIFELRLLCILGYAPYARGCMECGGEELANMMFSFKRCGLVCAGCAANEPNAIKVSPGAARAVNHIVHSPINDLFSFNLSSEVLNELDRISKRYLRDRLEKDYRKLDFLKTLEV